MREARDNQARWQKTADVRGRRKRRQRRRMRKLRMGKDG